MPQPQARERISLAIEEIRHNVDRGVRDPEFAPLALKVIADHAETIEEVIA